MKSRLFRFAVIPTGIALLGLAVWLFVGLRPLTFDVAAPQREVPVEVFGLGTVEARILSDIGFEVGAALVELNADHGDRVEKGQVVARLHDAEQQARVSKAMAGLTIARAKLAMSRAEIGKARAVLARKKQANRRKQELFSRRTVSEEIAEEAETEENVAAADLEVAISNADVARAALKDAQAQLDLEKVLLEHHVLAAPFDAVIVERHKELGAVVGPGETLFTLVAPETVWVLAYVDEARAGDVRLGQPAKVRLRSMPRRTFAAHVTRIGIESDRVSEERRIHVACDECPESFHLGEQAEVFITTATLREALLVPETAVEAFDGTTGKIWTIENGELNRREVSFGHRTLDSRLEIADGLPEGALVVTELRPGMREGRAARASREPAE